MNNLQQSIQVLQSLNIPVNYSSSTIQQLTDNIVYDTKSEEEYLELTKQVLGVDEVNVNDGKYGFLYTVQEIINRNNSFEQKEELDDLMDVVSKKVDTFISKYGTVDKTTEVKKVVVKRNGNGNGNGNGKKGQKRENCHNIYKDHFGKKTRKEILCMFVEQAEMTMNGASTYYANFGPKGCWRSEIHDQK